MYLPSRIVVTAAAICAVTPLANAAAQNLAAVPLFRTSLIANSDSGLLGNVIKLHILSDGGMIVVDASKRRVIILDSTLKKSKIVAGAGAGTPPYGMGQGGLVSYVGDSAAFIDQSSQALITVGKNGTFGRIAALPRPTDMRFLTAVGYGNPGFDTKGRLFYRGVPPSSFPQLRDNLATVFSQPDSAPVIRADLNSRSLDTIAWTRVPLVKQKTYRLASETSCCQTIINPIPVIDDWVYDPKDGTVAIVRGRDYHIDWFLPNGTKKSTPKMPIAWRRITDEEKKRIVDSVGHNLDSLRTALLSRMPQAQRTANAPPRAPPPPIEVVKPDELPEYYPAIKTNGRSRFDLEGNLWVIPATSLLATPDGGLAYDVFNRDGVLIKRVKLPLGRVLSGFGPGDLIYMTVLGTMWTRVERAQVIPVK